MPHATFDSLRITALGYKQLGSRHFTPRLRPLTKTIRQPKTSFQISTFHELEPFPHVSFDRAPSYSRPPNQTSPKKIVFSTHKQNAFSTWQRPCSFDTNLTVMIMMPAYVSLNKKTKPPHPEALILTTGNSSLTKKNVFPTREEPQQAKNLSQVDKIQSNDGQSKRQQE